MKIYTIGKTQSTTSGHGESGSETRICGLGSWGGGPFPPAFLSLEAAQKYRDEMQFNHNLSVVSLEIEESEFTSEDLIHDFFELSYCSYLVLPRSVLQSMPEEWQRKFVKMLNELETEFSPVPSQGSYEVTLRSDSGAFIHDEFRDYERGRRRLTLKSERTTPTREEEQCS
jgi:hypothetical protein